MKGPNQSSSAFKPIALIAAKEFGDRFRSGWVIACVAVWLGAIVLTSLFGLVQIGRIGVQGYERTVISLLNLVQYLVPLLALLIGHDLIAGEREDRTLSLVLSAGVSRVKVLFGKFLGGCLTLAFPLVLGFLIAGVAIALAANDRQFGPFLLLASSALGLAVVFVAIGLLVSSICRTRVQALVVSLLCWCLAVFVFDLVALGVLVSSRAPQAVEEIEVACDPTHLNSTADIHAAFESLPDAQSQAMTRADTASLSWLYLNPVDFFRAVNLSSQTGMAVPSWACVMGVCSWLAITLFASGLVMKRRDL